MRVAVLAVALSTLALGCGPPAIREGVFRCTTSADCPPGLGCAGDGLCRSADGGLPATCNWVRGGTIPPLPSGCLPRCETSTLSDLGACGTDTACRDAALAADGAAPLAWSVDGVSQPTDLRCAQCVYAQQASCAVGRCPAETSAWLGCTASCDDEAAALNTCLMGDPSYPACANMRVAQCFP